MSSLLFASLVMKPQSIELLAVFAQFPMHSLIQCGLYGRRCAGPNTDTSRALGCNEPPASPRCFWL